VKTYHYLFPCRLLSQVNQWNQATVIWFPGFGSPTSSPALGLQCIVPTPPPHYFHHPTGTQRTGKRECAHTCSSCSNNGTGDSAAAPTVATARDTQSSPTSANTLHISCCTVSEVPNRHVNHLGAEMLLLTHFVLLWGEK
jgi:hypothetical protein